MNAKGIIETPVGGEFQQPLVDSIDVPESTLNQLFAALFMVVVGVFGIANFILHDALVLRHSGQVVLACLAVFLIVYTLSRCQVPPDYRHVF